MKRKMRFLLLVACLVLPLCSCGNHNNKIKNPDLYTVAIHSLLWNNGFSMQTERYCAPQISILETDEYGRIMFSYQESALSGKVVSLSGYLICQYADDQFVYYYPEEQFLSAPIDIETKQAVSFTDSQIAELKQKNDWGKELNLEQCVKREIVKKKEPLPKEITEKVTKEFLSEQLEGISLFGVRYLTSDDYGRIISYGWASFEIETEKQYFVMLFNPDFTYDSETFFLIPSDHYDYQTELKSFKERNHWNEPIQ